MENIFENALFGKMYRTRDGRKAIYVGFNPLTNYVMLVIDAFEPSFFDSIAYYPDGAIAMGEMNNSKDIVSEWEDPINEDKLSELANKKLLEEIKIAKQSESLGQCYGVDFVSGFKNGYKAAKKENKI